MNNANMISNNYGIKTIGIVGGGQLGRMICFAAHKMGFKTIIYCDNKDCVASYVTNNVIIANYDDFDELDRFINMVNIVTFEFENIPFSTIKYLNGKVLTYPNDEILKISQNRIYEKEFLNNINIETAKYIKINDRSDIVKNFALYKKAIIKTATMGYDGKGQYIISDLDQIDEILQIHKDNQLIMEQFCAFDFEISVIIARSSSSELKCYEPVQNIHKNSILYKTIYPSPLSEEMSKKAQEIAIKIATKIDLIGILAVEFFVKDNKLYVNELAPRPHNSGHITMDLCFTSQFEQLIRAICGIKLGNVNFFAKGYMKNIIGNDLELINQYCNNSNAKIHLYDKSEALENRKMGHINVITQE